MAYSVFYEETKALGGSVDHTGLSPIFCRKMPNTNTPYNEYMKNTIILDITISTFFQKLGLNEK